MKTRSPDIQKRPVTDCPKGARIGVSLGLVREKSEKIGSLFGHPSLIWNPSGTFPGSLK